ncbi:hypothetical protein [Brevundimonas sp. GN22]
MKNYGAIGLALLIVACDTNGSSSATAASPVGPMEEPEITPATTSETLLSAVARLNDLAVRKENEISASQTAQYGEPSSEAYKHQVDQIEIYRRDLDGNGISDAVAVIYACEEQNCHSTTRSTHIGLLYANANSFEVAHFERYDLRAKIVDLWGADGLVVEAKDYGPNDPSCCPSLVKRSVIKLPTAQLP